MLKKAFSAEIKTIDENIIEGEIIQEDEEYVAIKQKNDRISFIQWHIISFIFRNGEIVMVNHDREYKKYSVLKVPDKRVSAKDIQPEKTEKLSQIFQAHALSTNSLTATETPHSDQTKNGDKQVNASAGSKCWSGNVNAGLTIQTGNKETLTANTKVEAMREAKKNIIYFTGLILLETKDSEKSTDEQRGTVKYERKHKSRLYSFFQESIEHDEIERLNLRSITSSGVGYRFIEKEQLKHKAEIGPSFTYERFQDSIQQTSAGLRLGSYLDWQMFASTKYYFKLDFLPVPGDAENWRLESDMGFRHALSKHLSVNLSWIDDYDNKPSAKDVGKNDATILSSVGYNF
jgi:putative salt-induced outer membrane protein YdiY